LFTYTQINYTLSPYVETSVANLEAEITLMRLKLAKLITQQCATRLNKAIDLMDASFAGFIESSQRAYRWLESEMSPRLDELIDYEMQEDEATLYGVERLHTTDELVNRVVSHNGLSPEEQHLMQQVLNYFKAWLRKIGQAS
jgi:hypothetical protein